MYKVTLPAATFQEMLKNCVQETFVHYDSKRILQGDDLRHFESLICQHDVLSSTITSFINVLFAQKIWISKAIWMWMCSIVNLNDKILPINFIETTLIFSSLSFFCWLQSRNACECECESKSKWSGSF